LLSLSTTYLSLFLFPRPYPEIPEQRRCAFPVFAAVDGSINHADGVDAHLDWVFHE